MMVLPKLSVLAAATLALAPQALACVQYDCNLNYENGLFNAALTDNGQQKCQLTNYYEGLVTASNSVVELSCIAGYQAWFDFSGGVVTYQYGSFKGSFACDYYLYENLGGIYYVANVWGC